MENSGMKTDTKGVRDTISEAGRSAKPAGFDFNRLYGDLSKKLLSTPVEEIFSDVISGAQSKKTSPVGGSTSPSSIHPAFALYGSPTNSPLSYFDKHVEQSGSMIHPLSVYSRQYNPLLMATKDVNYINNKSENNSPTMSDKEIPGGLDNYDMENVDIQNLVDEFKVTLERYGVSQRFAARFIMQDTSQGNLSFLMEKGKNKKWAELSARGRLPYIKMKEWLQNKEHQIMTLEMVKYSQEARKNTPRESFNRRERFSMLQLNVLCRMFEENPNPPMHVRTSVAERLGIPLDRVNVWFQNQRARGFPAKKNLQFQTMYESGQDSAKLVDMDVEYSKFRESLSSELEKSPLMTPAEDLIISQKFHQSDSQRTAKRAQSPKVPNPTSTLFTKSLKTDDAPLDLSATNHSNNTAKGSSNNAAKSSSNNTAKSSSNIKHGENLHSFQNEQTTAANELSKVNEVEREITADTHYTAQGTSKHSTEKAASNDTEEDSGNTSQVKSGDNNECSSQSTESTALKTQDFKTKLKCENQHDQDHSNDVLKVLCASIAMKKDNLTTGDVKEPELD
ncbi:DNA-binding transcription factor [Mactra antiquata]